MGEPEGWKNRTGHSLQSVEMFVPIVFYTANIKKITANFQLLTNSDEFCRDFVLPGLGQAVDDKRGG